MADHDEKKPRKPRKPVEQRLAEELAHRRFIYELYSAAFPRKYGGDRERG